MYFVFVYARSSTVLWGVGAFGEPGRWERERAQGLGYRRRMRRNGKVRHRVKTQTEDGFRQPKPGEIAHLLHLDMVAHRKKTADFNNGWKRALCLAAIGLAVVSLLKAVEKARDGDSSWVERAVTATNAGLIAGWVTQADGWAATGSLLLIPSAGFTVSVYQLVMWWTSRQGGVHVDFPVSIILFIVVVVSISSMKSTQNAADDAFRASSALAEKVSSNRKR